MPDPGPPPPRPGWFTSRADGTRSYVTAGSGPVPSPPAPRRPVRIRMFVDDVSGIGLWPDLAWDYDGSPFAALFETDPVEAGLPITGDLRDRIRAWVDDYTAFIETGALDPVAHDRLGRALSQRLQRELGADYEIRYLPHTTGAES